MMKISYQTVKDLKKEVIQKLKESFARKMGKGNQQYILRNSILMTLDIIQRVSLRININSQTLISKEKRTKSLLKRSQRKGKIPERNLKERRKRKMKKKLLIQGLRKGKRNLVPTKRERGMQNLNLIITLKEKSQIMFLNLKRKR